LSRIIEKYQNHNIIPLCKCSFFLEDITYTEHILDSKGTILTDRCKVVVAGRELILHISFEELEELRDTNHVNTNKFEIRGFQEKR
jgi:hypothetical protein